MNSKKYIKYFIITLSFFIIGIGGFNYYTDPFSAFNSSFKEWYSYGFTQNPRIAKINYLDKNHNKFDSYVVGASGSSSFPVEDLNKYTDGKFYNLFYYGADMLDTVNTVKYILENYEVKNIILPIGLTNASKYNYGDDTLNDKMNYKLSGENPLKFYYKLLFANPNYGLDKLKAEKEDTYIQKNFDVFNVENGSYDKALKDVENISDLSVYLENPDNQGFSLDATNIDLSYVEEFESSMKEVINMCNEKGVNYKVIMVPMYYKDFESYDKNQARQFYNRLSQITDFWDFTNSEISYDARYFYDRTHFRNNVGKMMLAKIFGDKDVFYPNNFGNFINSQNWEEGFNNFYAVNKFQTTENSTKLPVFMYHNIDVVGDNDVTISQENFEKQIKFIKESGFNTVSIKELKDYVNKGINLPENPVLITFDDGYESNYEIAYPILKKYNMKATIFVIGSSVGKDTYKESGEKITPHFNINQAKEMVKSGVIEIQSHTFDMHQSKKFEKGKVRENILRFAQESEKDYIEILNKDMDQENSLIKEITGSEAYALAYPYGEYDDLAAVLISQKGIESTLTTKAGPNTIIKGIPQSLFELNRYVLIDETSLDVIREELVN